MREVELHPAFRFDCDECGREVFTGAIVGDLTEAAMKAHSEAVMSHWEAPEYTLDEDGNADAPYLIQRILLVPSQVSCPYCGASFDAVIPEIEEKEGEDDE